jgi:hypothetical protein
MTLTGEEAKLVGDVPRSMLMFWLELPVGVIGLEGLVNIDG